MFRRPMPGYEQRCWSVFRRQYLVPRCVSQSVRHASSSNTETNQLDGHSETAAMEDGGIHLTWRPEDIQPTLQPSPANLLRFALTGTTVAQRTLKRPAELPKLIDKAFDTDWSSDAASLPAFWKQQLRMFDTVTRTKFEYNLYNKVQRIPHLQAFIQRYVFDERGAMLLQAAGCHMLAKALSNCQRYHSYQEILAVLNAIILRIQKLGVLVNKHLLALAIHYAALAFSAEAMRPHVEALASTPRKLRGRNSASTVTTLIYSLHALESQNLRSNTKAMRHLVDFASDNEQLEQHDLNKLLFWSQTIPAHRCEIYLPLLAELRMHGLLDSAWEWIKESMLSEQNLGPIYLAVVYLVRNGSSLKALAWLKQLSDLFRGTLPGISKTKYLGELLENPGINEALPQLAGEQERLGILEAQLEILEHMLGVRWEPEKSIHVGLSDPNCNATDMPLFDMDGDAPGYDSSERLVAEIMARGCSKYVKDLGRIAGLLDDHEGQIVPILTSEPDCEFGWYPERSPLKFSDTPPTLQTDLSRPWSLSSLGLLRVRLEGNQISPAPQYPVRIMPLGHLLVRRKWQSERNRLPHLSYQWTETGFIVGWDRVHARFVLVWASPDKEFETRFSYMDCESIVPKPGCLSRFWEDPWVIDALDQPLRMSHFVGTLEEDPGLELIE